jgi:hypothetical protein
MFDTVIVDAITRNEVSRRREKYFNLFMISYQNMKKWRYLNLFLFTFQIPD